ncbi:MAG: hypothetical protein IPF98_02410 [Gemmatimonadetes bacterium]|nr:hypothetical protein [Gemmatimonadota bacterium]MCC6774812.1 hypothetical protein [Gemmatimonadaceae bacterium]
MHGLENRVVMLAGLLVARRVVVFADGLAVLLSASGAVMPADQVLVHVTVRECQRRSREAGEHGRGQCDCAGESGVEHARVYTYGRTEAMRAGRWTVLANGQERSRWTLQVTARETLD